MIGDCEPVNGAVIAPACIAYRAATANDHVQIATQERAIAGIQADNAKDSVEFLTNKFTNVDLFDWMSNILEGV